MITCFSCSEFERILEEVATANSARDSELLECSFCLLLCAVNGRVCVAKAILTR